MLATQPEKTPEETSRVVPHEIKPLGKKYSAVSAFNQQKNSISRGRMLTCVGFEKYRSIC
jgi:hypothetical protein